MWEAKQPLWPGELVKWVGRPLAGWAAGESWQQFPAAAWNVGRSDFGFVLLLFLLLHLTLVMKSGLLGFSHYLFIKDMTRNWELPWRQLHKVSKLYAELHCLLFCQERGAEWGAGGVFSFFFFFLLRLSLVPLSLFVCFVPQTMTSLLWSF